MLDFIGILIGLFIIWRIADMSAALARLQAELTENTEATNAVLNLVESLSAEIRANAGDEAAMTKLADSLDENSNKLAAAVTAGTEAESPDTPAEDLEPISEDGATDESGTPTG